MEAYLVAGLACSAYITGKRLAEAGWRWEYLFWIPATVLLWPLMICRAAYKDFI